MANYNFKLDLSKFEGFGTVTLTGKSGTPKKCVVIPVDDNHIFLGDKGTYLDLVCFETPNLEYGSHMVTLSKTKEEQKHEKQTGERIRKPIVGNLKPFGNKAAEEEEYTYGGQQAAQQVAQTAKSRKAEITNENFNDSDNLPF